MSIYLTKPSNDFQCGGKAAHLWTLQSLGFAVPPFVVVPWEVLHKADDVILAQLGAEINNHLAENLATTRFAVRSSALSEDGAAHSFAGQFETYLDVSAALLPEKIAAVRDSARSSRVRAYRRAQGLSDEASIGVVVQRMISPDAAGVAFGANPVSGNRQEKVISAVWGLGESLVSGLSDADTYTVNAEGDISSQIAHKPQMLVRNPTGEGTIMIETPVAKCDTPCLHEVQIRAISEALDRLNTHFGQPQDIEFAFADGQLFLLQTRPITTLKPASPVLEGRVSSLVWDNSNIVESYPGHTLPLTFSFILKMYESVYRQLMRVMGVTEREITDNSAVLANMLGLIEGRVYYNLLNWYRALAILPGFALNAAFMERMMGVKERFVLTDIPVRSRAVERLRVLNLLRCMIGNLWGLPRLRRDFEKAFNIILEEYYALDFSKKSADELMALYLSYEQTLLQKWKAPLVNDFFAMIYFGVLQKLTVKYELDEGGTLHNDLLCGARDIVSTEPIHRCLYLAAAIQNDPTTKQLFLEKSHDELAVLFQNGSFAIPVQTQIDEYLARWGDRCVGELKLETITYRQNPASFLKLIQSYVRQGIQPTQSRIDLDMRERAEQVVKEKLRRKPVRRAIFNHVLRNTRELVSGRENLRYARTRAYGVVRNIFSALGLRFAESGLLSEPNDIFYLTQSEIFDYVKGTSVNGSPQLLVDLRKNQYTAWAQSPPPAERFATSGIVYADNDFRLNRNPVPTADNSDLLKGLGCCPGRVRARVRVVRHPSEVGDLGGDILVTSNTDPGWVTLFPTAGGILVEKGSLLSHSAIVSREMGKPCIVGITGLLQRLQTGDWVEMDGATGLIFIQDQALT